MRALGERWYGGALETLCQALAWRELTAGHYVSPEDVGAALNRAAGDGIVYPLMKLTRRCCRPRGTTSRPPVDQTILISRSTTSTRRSDCPPCQFKGQRLSRVPGATFVHTMLDYVRKRNAPRFAAG